METKLLEATNGPMNWGKFMLGRFTDELEVISAIDSRPLVASRGWRQNHFLMVDLQTGEGSMFKLGGLARADINAHRIWVCPLFEPVLIWLYARYVGLDHQVDPWWQTMPVHVDLPDAAFAMQGYRRQGGS
jgi:hypothetical protein